MWLSKKQRETPPAQESVQLGVATISGDPAGVYLGTERRSLPIFSPGGYRWKPRVGDAMLVLKTGDAYCISGMQQEANELKPGEVCIESSAGARVMLKADGSMELSGEVLINGETLENMIKRLAGGLLLLT